MKEKLCEICWEKPATKTCKLCRRNVCEDHFIPEESICVVCRDALCSVCRKNLSIATCPICGRHVCHDCLVDYNSSRICYMCVMGERSGLLKIRKRMYKTSSPL